MGLMRRYTPSSSAPSIVSGSAMRVARTVTRPPLSRATVSAGDAKTSARGADGPPRSWADAGAATRTVATHAKRARRTSERCGRTKNPAGVEY